jgi:hypothetical protein
VILDEEKIERIEEELDSAQRDLRETMNEVEMKVGEEVERAGGALSLTKALSTNMVGAACVATLFGYLVGSSKYQKVGGAALLVAFGFTVWSSMAERHTGPTDQN